MVGVKEQKPNFSQEQYDKLRRCSEENNLSEWNEWRNQNIDTPTIMLEGADLAGANLSGVELWEADLKGANLQGADLKRSALWKADLRDARLEGADLRGAKLIGANCQGATLIGTLLKSTDFTDSNLQEAKIVEAQFQESRLWKANLKGAVIWQSRLQSAKFDLICVDGMTTISACQFDKETDFSGAGLDAASIDPGLKAALKDNIRRIQWQKWFAKGNWAAQALKNCFVRPFWWMTGYGSSTANIIYYFVVLAYLFGSLYFFLELTGCGVVEGLGVAGMPWYHTWLRGLYFSVVTMTTLGFGDLYAMKTSYLGHVLLMVQVILGYVLLGALVTRLGILFTSEAPAAKPTPLKLKDK